MEKNQNDTRNQQADSKSTQPSTKDANKKEINPNNPTANQVKQQDPKKDNQGRPTPTSPEGNKGKIQEKEEEETEEITDETDLEFTSEEKDNKKEN